jgi:hypothetical protein
MNMNRRNLIGSALALLTGSLLFGSIFGIKSVKSVDGKRLVRKPATIIHGIEGTILPRP